MGEHADDIIKRIFSEEFGQWGRYKDGFQKGAGKGMWRNGEGFIYKMEDMSDFHIENAIGVCRKTNNTGKERELMDEMRKRILSGRNPNIKRNGPLGHFHEAKTALMFEMILPQEYEEIIKGNMHIEKSVLINLNVGHASGKTPLQVGEKTTVSHGRAKELSIQKLLGEW